MTEPVKERVLQDVKTTLEKLTKPNGYSFTFAESNVQRWSMYGNSTADLPVIIITTGDQTEKPKANNIQECSLEVILAAFIVHDEDDPVSSDTYANRLEADIKKIIMVDEQRGTHNSIANALSTDVVGTSPFESVENQAYIGIVVELLIRYRHLTNDPTTAA